MDKHLDGSKTKRVVADRSICVGAGKCAQAAPTVFDQDDEEGLVYVLDPELPIGDMEAVLEAEMSCPSGAIKVLRKDS